MPKNKRKLNIVLLMILSVFLLFTGCGRGREIVPAQETTGAFEAEKDREEGQAKKSDLYKETIGSKQPAVPAPDQETFTAENKNLHNEKTVVVHVCGAVNSPGIYTMPEGSRLWEAVKAAGGVTEDGAGDYLNMAAPVTDGEKVVVPFLADVEEPFGEAGTLPARAAESGAAENGSGKDNGAAAGSVNLNTAGLEQLMTLPGVGESKAKAIMEYRENIGPFTVPEDITNVPGIKQGSYEKLKDYITV